jgi:hypothetical protein
MFTRRGRTTANSCDPQMSRRWLSVVTAREPFETFRSFRRDGQAIASRRSSHACLQRRHSSAQSRQCSWWAAWRSHSSEQATHAVEQASSVVRISLRSGMVCRATIRRVASHSSAQSLQSRMTRSISVTSASLKLASAQAVQLAAQSRHSSIQRSSVSRSTSLGRGWSLMISR